ncbi:MAG: LysM peptidoglycan-binding domain-containing protein [Smithellaceae bacterium]|nr:LysM peptidoglycan-binding domain-containing protein [Smithellaceae bacterium]
MAYPFRNIGRMVFSGKNDLFLLLGSAVTDEHRLTGNSSIYHQKERHIPVMMRVFIQILVTASILLFSPFTISGLAQPQNPDQTIRLEKKEQPAATPASQISLPEQKNLLKKKIDNPAAAGKPITHRDKQDLMEEALELINESEAYWKKGDIEIALDILDQAYALVLTANGNADIARQKDDLRLLISRRILAMYSATKFSVTNGKASQIPLVLNEDIEKEIRSFQTGERNFFIQSYRRSAFYLPIILRELKRAGLPLELAWLPLVESGYKINALSHARALGLWQFIPSTGYKFGLNRNEWIDERLDLEKSTLAAIAYLSELHGMFGDWLTALAAYNCGEGRLLRVISAQRINYFDRFWDLYHQLPYETARYVPRFLATLHIVNDPKKYGFDFSNEEESEQKIRYTYDKVVVNKSMRLQDIAIYAESSEETLNILNAELRHKVTPNTPYELKIPKEALEKFLAIQESIPKWRINAKKVVRHRIKRGETIESIARMYNLSPRAIRENNRTSSKKPFVAGRLIRVPINEEDTFTLVSSSGEPLKTPEADSNRRKQPDDPQEIIKYKVKANDNLSALAKRFALSVDEIKNMNNLRTAVLKTGQVLVVSKGALKTNDIEAAKPSKKIASGKAAQAKAGASSGKEYIVKNGDNLSVIAKKFNTSVVSITQSNGLTEKDSIRAGQRLNIN